MKRLSRGVTAAVFIGGLALSPMPIASAHVVPSFISAGVSDHTVGRHQKIFFFGDLRTPGHRRCHRFAQVVLKRLHTGVVATTTTDAQGTYAFKIDPKPNHGRYYVRFRGLRDFGYQNSHGCTADNSRLIHIRRRR